MSKLNLILPTFRVYLLGFFLQITIIPSLFAKDAKDDNYITINSESLKIDRELDIAVFEGEVILWFEDTIVKTDKINIKYKNGEKKSIDNIIIPYKLSAYRTLTDEIIIAESAEYKHDEAKLVFYGNVMLETQTKILKTPMLVYYTALRQSNKFDLSNSQ